SGSFDPIGRTFILYVSQIRGITMRVTSVGGPGSGDTTFGVEVADFSSTIALDSLYQIKSSNTLTNSGQYHDQEIIQGTIKFPPQKIIALQNPPSIISPKNNWNGIGTDNIVLLWKALALIDKYHLQVSLDSSFNSTMPTHPHIESINTIVDTVIVDTQYTLLPLSKNTKYFWRVAGINSEGESRWSDVWNFTTGATADVANAQISPFSFSAYPNPASDKLNVSYSSLEGDVSIGLFDLLGNNVRSLAQKGERSAVFSLTGLHAGMYVLQLRSGNVHRSMPISIVR
ncbi:MAG: T9SS type A sorting domain-containing protein, partial [Candidatus Kapaibacterium sp.]